MSYPEGAEWPARNSTESAVEAIVPDAEDILVWDATLPGFGVRVKSTGVRSYIVQYRNRETGASKRMTIGQHGPRLTFDQAKRQARALLTDALRGQDPVAERRSKRSAPSMTVLAYGCARDELFREVRRAEEAAEKRPR